MLHMDSIFNSTQRNPRPPAAAAAAAADITTLRAIGVQVRDFRKAKSLSQTALGQRAGLSRMPVYRLEAGRDVSLASLLAILHVLGKRLEFAPLASGPQRADDLARAFAHLRNDEEEEQSPAGRAPVRRDKALHSPESRSGHRDDAHDTADSATLRAKKIP